MYTTIKTNSALLVPVFTILWLLWAAVAFANEIRPVVQVYSK